MQLFLEREVEKHEKGRKNGHLRAACGITIKKHNFNPQIVSPYASLCETAPSDRPPLKNNTMNPGGVQEQNQYLKLSRNRSAAKLKFQKVTR